MDRRTTIKWMLAAAALPLARDPLHAATAPKAQAKPYGQDPKLLNVYHPGELWPLTFNAAQRRTATVLCDAIIPADATSPSASAVGVVDFLDEWISAPYPAQQKDRAIVLKGLHWLDRESGRRFFKPAHELDAQQLHAICDDICYLPKARPHFVEAARFFARYRDLTASGFYTTPEGRKDLQFVGNVPLASFDGPPLEVLKKVGLA
ncbi:gluconate 2-dehydrogenase subunit 3 family protein [Rudaea sp.]|uniref:gluconate 2-dehydrogenase subunit 3 family protein n=1 Tax=Rudaea sp. TaxID=2136325 RepID=UPI002ED2198E